MSWERYLAAFGRVFFALDTYAETSIALLLQGLYCYLVSMFPVVP